MLISRMDRSRSTDSYTHEPYSGRHYSTNSEQPQGDPVFTGIYNNRNLMEVTESIISATLPFIPYVHVNKFVIMSLYLGHLTIVV